MAKKSPAKVKKINDEAAKDATECVVELVVRNLKGIRVVTMLRTLPIHRTAKIVDIVSILLDD